jgi:hypothetical protein
MMRANPNIKWKAFLSDMLKNGWDICTKFYREKSYIPPTNQQKLTDFYSCDVSGVAKMYQNWRFENESEILL